MLLTHTEVSQRIDNGEVLVIHHGRVLKLNKWLSKHPGGDKAILHMVGRDASDEMDVYHSDETLSTMKAYSIGTVDLPWKNIVPPIQRDEQHTQFERFSQDKSYTITEKGSKAVLDKLEEERQRDLAKYPELSEKTQLNIRSEFRKLHKNFEKDGFFDCNYWAYFYEARRIVSLLILSAVLFYYREKSAWMLWLSATALGLAWHQTVFIVHDAGHLAITHNYYADNFIGSFLATFVGGLSMGWWKRNHNVHHLVTNDPVHDPDIQHLPFFAVTSKLFKSVWSTYYEKILWFDAIARKMIRIQHYTYYPILCFGRFNLYSLSWEYVLLGLGPREGKAKYLRHFEFVGLTTFCYWFFYIVVGKLLHTWHDRLVFVLWSHIVTMPVHVQITLSHFAQSTSDLGLEESFAQRQVRTTMDVACPEWMDYVHGGLQFQAIHHLFPRMPRHNFRRAQARVMKFCERLGLHYEIYGFARGNKHVIGRLQDIAQQAAVFTECNEFCKQELVGDSKQ